MFADLKFRLQHNGLRLRVRYRYHTSDVFCSHGCNSPETAKHLFWECSMATNLWIHSLFPIFGCLEEILTWETVVYGTNFAITTSATRTYGTHNIIRVLNVFRCIILRTLWLARNVAIVQHQEAYPTQLYRMVRGYLLDHIRRLKHASPTNAQLMALCDVCL